MEAAKSELAQNWSNLFSYSNLVHAVSGAAGSVVAISVFYPLDTVRTRLQVDDQRQSKNTLQALKDIIKEEGIIGLYRGYQSLCWTTLMSSFIYFYTYVCIQYSQHVLYDNHIAIPPSSGDGYLNTGISMSFDLIIAFFAGCVNVLVTTPLWVANTRLKLQGAKLHTEQYNKKFDTPANRKYAGILDCLLKITQTEGISKLWGGTVPSLLLATNPAIQFMVYEALKRYFKQLLKVSELSSLMYFVLGAVAKAVATVITYPLQVVQSRLRAGYAKLESSQTLIQNLIHLVQTKGFGFLYKGMEAKLLQTVLTAALMFSIYEKIANFIFKAMRLR